MGSELATIVAVRRTSMPGRARPTVPAGAEALTDRIPTSPDDVHVVAFATPSEALGAIESVLGSDPAAAVALHVAELADDPSLNAPAVDLVRTLARRAAAGDVVLTDVVAQLAGGTGRRFSSRGHVRVAGRAIRLHGLTAQRDEPTSPTFGRAVELASLDWLVDELLAGSGRTVILEGEAGIGKTHLTTEALSRAASSGVVVARSAADELGRDRPGHLAAALLAALTEHTTGAADDRATLVGGGDHAFIERFTAAVESQAQAQPVLLVAEDLHWADDLSLRAIGALGRRLAPIAAALVVTLRPAPRPDLLGTLEAVLEDAGAEHHRLDPLDPEAVTALVATVTGAPPGPRLRDRLLTTAGNPLFVIEMLDALAHDEALDVDAGVVEVDASGVALPERLRETALRRIRDLPDLTVSLLRHAALLGSACELTSLATVTERAATSIISELVPAVDAGVLARTGDRVEFRHDVIREAIVDDLAPAARREMHRAAGAALARSGAPPVQVARQLALGADPGDTEPVEWLQRAAADVRFLDPSATVDLLREALELAPPGWAGSAHIECSMIEPLTAAGRVDEAVARAEAVVARTEEAALRIRAHLGLISALSTRGDLQRAAEVAERASSEPEVDARQRLVLGCIATSLRIFVDGRADEARSTALAALSASTDGPADSAQDELACWARNALGIAALVDGSYAEALEHFDESSRLLDRLEISDHGFLIPHLHAGTAAAYVDDVAAFDARLRTLMDHLTTRGETGPLVVCHFGGAGISYLTGRWDDATAEMEAGLSLAAETGADSMTIGLHALAALVAADRGRPDEADQHLEQGFEVLARGAHLFGVDLLVLARARRLEELGDDHEAAALLAGFWDQAGHLALALQHRDLLPQVVRVAGPLLGGRVDEVLAAADHAADQTPVPSVIAAAKRCHGLATGEADLVVEAVELLHDSPRRTARAETCEEAATMLFSAGRPDEAAALVDEAVAIWAEVGATTRISRIDALARTNGVRRRRSRAATATHGWAALSPKELEVVDLVADGLSNPAIGERLYISRRTVESHLSHVFAKLGLANRAQLAAAVVERRGRPQDR